jgi:hypothetical protein
LQSRLVEAENGRNQVARLEETHRYSPDITPSDFFLFREVKRQPKGHLHISGTESKWQFVQFLIGVGQNAERVFEDWIADAESSRHIMGTVLLRNQANNKESVAGDLPLSFRRLMKYILSNTLKFSPICLQG